MKVKILQRPGFDNYPAEKRAYILLGDLIVQVDGCTFVVPEGFVFDGSSVPRPVRWIVDSDDMGLIAPAVHDFLFPHGEFMCTDGRLQRWGRIKCDRVYHAFAKEDGVKPWKRKVALVGLLVGSWTRWKGSGNKS